MTKGKAGAACSAEKLVKAALYKFFVINIHDIIIIRKGNTNG